MKRFFIYFLFGLMAFSSACGMFFLKFHVIEKEIVLSRMHKQIRENNRSIHVLNAEWANLNNPERLTLLATEKTSLQPMQQFQIIDWENIQVKSLNDGETN